MPLIRKLIKVGNSRAVVIPPDWLKYYEDKTGEPVKEVFLELNGSIKITVEDPQNGRQTT
jgi:antitoxin component of MazEF toxin-antitoxin module